MKIRILLPLLLICFSAFAQTERKITAKFTDIPEGTWLYLNDGSFDLDSSAGNRGVYEFRYTNLLESPEPLAIVTGNKKSFVLIWLDEDDLEIEGSFKDLENLKTKGSQTLKDFNLYMFLTDKLSDSLGQSRYLLTKSRARKESDTLELKKQIEDQNNRLKTRVTAFINHHRASYLSVYLLEMDARNGFYSKAETLELLGILSEKNQNSAKAKSIHRFYEINIDPQVGVSAPSFSMESIDGKIITLADLKGKTVLLLFWASWCGPCRAEAPFFKEVYDRYKKRGFEVVAVSLDNKKDQWENFINKMNTGWVNVSDLKGWTNEAALIYGVSKVPDNFLIDADGIIIGRDLLPLPLDQKLREILKRR